MDRKRGPSHRRRVDSPQVTSVDESFSSSCESWMVKSVQEVSTQDGESISLTIRRLLMAGGDGDPELLVRSNRTTETNVGSITFFSPSRLLSRCSYLY